MSPEHAMRQVRVLGDGCAALSLAARADELAGHKLTLFRPQGAPQETDHIWGFWDGPNLAAASRLARKLLAEEVAEILPGRELLALEVLGGVEPHRVPRGPERPLDVVPVPVGQVSSQRFGAGGAGVTQRPHLDLRAWRPRYRYR